jgi:hypothetical protein
LKLDPEKQSHRKRITKMLGVWVKNGALKVVTRPGENRHPKEFIEVGQWAT